MNLLYLLWPRRAAMAVESFRSRKPEAPRYALTVLLTVASASPPAPANAPAPRATEVASGHREVRHPHDHRRTLAVLGNAKPVVDRAAPGARVDPRGGPNVLGRDARDLRDFLRGVFGVEDHGLPGIERIGVAALGHVLLVGEAFADDVSVLGAMQESANRHARALLDRQRYRLAYETDPMAAVLPPLR